MKAIEPELTIPFSATTWRWITPVVSGAALGAVALAIPPVQEIFQLEGLRWLHVFLFAFLGTGALTPLMVRIGHRWNLVDVPADRKIHVLPTPRIGGLALYAGFVGSLLLNSIVPDWIIAILIAGSLLLIIGVLDDIRELPASGKLIGQLMAAGIVIASGKVLTLFPPSPLGEAANMLLTLFWIVGITNAFNFFDGMDGLATGLAILLAGFLGVVAFETNQAELGWLAIAMIGAGLGFLPYNFRGRKPAVIFLGDGGSTFIGFTLACLAIKGNWADSSPIVSFSNPLLIFGVLIYDMIHITVERIATGKVRSVKEWLDYVGKDHLHHRLERALGSRQASVAMIFLFTICLGLSALALRHASTMEAVLLLIQAGLIAAMLTVLEISGRRR
ncbi:MAG: undecaprenyl/decaprenyl-phosphate alpha-N-acetylglucosaminyl 1-phosphate transferase [Nitrospira sp.]|nr:undecaprenyl/decaprenyl-phosphate alpha-N-acetylglucosaminyl 1-phosphate transferase [Nitrospira sp.]MDH4370426.1 undecaprenyl/decaprenyl-phosphate alpha-N-acetylglucosaminyl 1-phosphate transferase [Nitrospira sp.]MDH5496078.1 undecaprenyl/decaprenyl-phosphate alpha-N-acetylglucosaminyl 1-phosphate transferase [Nitrospira sp.]MDH5725125.1 undecaprenyl/decaprenyl-phosphate alpha-N-acetylglucosaminyl 1-phosphate transferase [Nitrospira sp.]